MFPSFFRMASSTFTRNEQGGSYSQCVVLHAFNANENFQELFGGDIVDQCYPFMPER